MQQKHNSEKSHLLMYLNWYSPHPLAPSPEEPVPTIGGKRGKRGLGVKGVRCICVVMVWIICIILKDNSKPDPRRA